MSVTIHIPTPLRPYVEGKDEVQSEEAGSLRSVLDQLTRNHDGLKKHLFDADGNLRKFVNIYVNDEDIRYQEGEDTAVSDGAVVSIVPSIAGGL
jgi:molybdopterin synthase sulfur carrier subunit